MPPASRTPRRKRVRRYFSASAATGSRWGGQLAGLSATASTRASHRGSSKSSTDGLDFSITNEDHSDVENTFRHRPPLAYASLPPTPICSSSLQPASPPLSSSLPSFPSLDAFYDPPFSLWDYLREELLATDFDSHQELKWERIFLFGFVLCLDSFMYTFTILPIRFTLASWRLILNTFSRSCPPLPPSQKADILRTLLLVVSIVILGPLTDASKLYHFIRGQDTIKLYVIFNALEIADRLCASIGQDILDCLFSRSTLEVISHRKRPTSYTLRPFFYFILAVFYNVSHALVMIYQMISLNVAVNSYDHALLTLLVSNQFVEIKGSVFKKFEKDNLFQITCADIVERFTLALMLLVVAFRNLIELNGSAFNFTEGFSCRRALDGSEAIMCYGRSHMFPVLTVMVSEMLVDWLKHAFIAKFNHIRPSVYERYTDVLCRDLASGIAHSTSMHLLATYVDQSPLVARRLGFASLPLAVLAILIGSQSVGLLISMHADERSPWMQPWRELSANDVVNIAKWAALAILFLVVKIMMGVHLLTYATRRRAGMEAREAADVVNDFGREPIGEGKEEQRYNHELKTLLDNRRDDSSPVAEIESANLGTMMAEAKETASLEEITRFTMVKRIGSISSSLLDGQSLHDKM
ncbi:Endoplasmic reticulum membrane protein 65 [Grifola frondosa]|uniref:Endoplasmic reticulum membrane protein 65 n=1 Tax=Grifola frondosa TaxID=5627 RepID=A0A1C7LYY3_GRIFR|nr:Endoplasmic reticulum membrane protein 65 [Grifola frondosa]